MAGASANTYKLLRSLWPQKSIYEEILEQSVTLGIIPKDTSFYEAHRYIDVGVAAPQGVGPDFAIAKASKTASKAEEFDITAKTYYGLISIEGRLMRQAKSDKAVIVKPLMRESKNVMTQVRRDLSAFIHGNGGGAIGQVTIVGNTVTLLDITRIRFVDRGMRISTATTDGTTGAINPGFCTVATVNRGAGSFTVVEATVVAGIPAAANNDYLFRYGIFGNVLAGFEGWNPNHNGTPGTFKGVNRNTDPTRTAGIPIDCSMYTPRRAMLEAASAVYDVGGNPDTYIISTPDWRNLATELQSAGSLTYTQVPASSIGKFTFGFKYTAIEFTGPAGPIKVFADPDAPVGVGRMLTLDTWSLASSGELLSFIDGASPGDLMVEDAADSFEARLVGDMETICEAPGYNARVKLA